MDILSWDVVIAIALRAFAPCWKEIGAGYRYRCRYRISIYFRQSVSKIVVVVDIEYRGHYCYRTSVSLPKFALLVEVELIYAGRYRMSISLQKNRIDCFAVAILILHLYGFVKTITHLPSMYVCHCIYGIPYGIPWYQVHPTCLKTTKSMMEETQYASYIWRPGRYPQLQ